MIKTVLIVLPLVVFGVLAGIFGVRVLDGADRSVVPSALIGRTVPDLSFPALQSDLPGITPASLQGRATLVNVWASWCAPCRIEHPIFMELATVPGLTIAGVNYKDRVDGARGFLAELGNPFDFIGVDPDGRRAIEWGVYGAPETFLVGPDGVIRAKHVGVLTPEHLAGPFGDTMRTAIREAAAAT